MNQPIALKRALLSVSDKTGIVELAKVLQQYNCEIISTGGTRRVLEEAGVPVTEISTVTGNPEAFGGKMKTISFNIESALLFDRVKDKEEAKQLGIEAIDLVVCNLYPFQKVLEEGADHDTLIENIDIGGPTMIRAAAKNYKGVAVVVDPSDYNALRAELESNNGRVSLKTRQQLMGKAFNHTADYDALIASTMNENNVEKSYHLSFDNGKTLRYGENSHQTAVLYGQKNTKGALSGLNQLHGKELSFNNILDINGAIESVAFSSKTACSVVKHSNPCGLCEGEDQTTVLAMAWAGDPISAFGSIVAFNTKLEAKTVQFFQLNNEDRNRRKFVEVVIAPDFEPEAIEYLQQHKNLRIIQYDSSHLNDFKDIRYLNGALLVQDKDNQLYDKLDIVTEKGFNLSQEQGLIEFGLRAIKNIKSNSIAIVRQKGAYYQLLGMGAGQPNRLVATMLAIQKCTENLAREYEGNNVNQYYTSELAQSILISDAFFPFDDNVVLAAEAGIRKIVQPGGSIRDKEVVATANKRGIAMLMTGLRHFKH